ncbi:MAG: hypothetical protein LBU89_13275 [Fibromonadaceae bacterium]|jgi:hypothetical protein|nr:hypothetical protein [Fibromonadaceae bacterium]
MKKLLLPFLIFGLVLQGCGGGCINPMPGMCGGGAIDPNAPIDPEFEWSLRLQIGDYVLDSIPAENSDRRVHITMDSITVKVPNYLDVPHIGRVYGWDPRCAGRIKFIPQWRWGGGGCANTNWIYIPVDPLGYFDFSKVLDRYPFEIFNNFPQPECGPGGKYTVGLEYYAGEGRTPWDCPTLTKSIEISLKP